MRFTTRKAKDLVFIKSRAERGSNIKVSEQYPPEMKEKRETQFDSLKSYKQMCKDTGTKFKLVKDKLFVGQQVVGATFEQNKLQPTPTDNVLLLQAITQTPIKEFNKSFFQGHVARITSFKEAAAVKQSLYQSPHIASSDHLIFSLQCCGDTRDLISGVSVSASSPLWQKMR